MKLAAMRYKDYVWPHNPRVYTIEYERRMGARKVPFGRYFLQDLGPAQRVMRGEGEFVGEEAYAEFKRLASVFYDDGPGLLVHPVWQTANAYFVELSLAQEPRADYVRYTFAFWEGYEGHNTTLRTQQGESAGSGASGTESRSWPPPGTDSCAPPSTRCWAGIWPWASPRWTARTRACPCPASSPSPPAAGPAGTGSSSSSMGGR